MSALFMVFLQLAKWILEKYSQYYFHISKGCLFHNVNQEQQNLLMCFHQCVDVSFWGFLSLFATMQKALMNHHICCKKKMQTWRNAVAIMVWKHPDVTGYFHRIPITTLFSTIMCTARIRQKQTPVVSLQYYDGELPHIIGLCDLQQSRDSFSFHSATL